MLGQALGPPLHSTPSFDFAYPDSLEEGSAAGDSPVQKVQLGQLDPWGLA
jgi:hypothetical protein